VPSTPSASLLAWSRRQLKNPSPMSAGDVPGDLSLLDHLADADADHWGVFQPPGRPHACDLGERGGP
jgi:hypothetical protein